MASKKIQQIWNTLNKSEKHGIKFGLFPAKLQHLTREELVELMNMSEGA